MFSFLADIISILCISCIDAVWTSIEKFRQRRIRLGGYHELSQDGEDGEEAFRGVSDDGPVEDEKQRGRLADYYISLPFKGRVILEKDVSLFGDGSVPSEAMDDQEIAVQSH